MWVLEALEGLNAQVFRGANRRIFSTHQAPFGVAHRLNPACLLLKAVLLTTNSISHLTGLIWLRCNDVSWRGSNIFSQIIPISHLHCLIRQQIVCVLDRITDVSIRMNNNFYRIDDMIYRIQLVFTILGTKFIFQYQPSANNSQPAYLCLIQQ